MIQANKFFHLTNKIKRLMVKFFFQIICGIDMIFAILFYIAFLGFYGIGWDPKLLALSILFAHLPDISMFIYPFIKKWVIKMFGIPSHRPLTHHPLLMIPAVAAICYFWLAPWLGYPPAMLATLAMLCLLVHFIHDSIEPQGFHWLSPFSWERIRIMWFKIVRIPRDVWYKIHWEKDKVYEHDGAKSEITKRADPLSDMQVAIAWLSYVMLLFCWIFPGTPLIFLTGWVLIATITACHWLLFKRQVR